MLKIKKRALARWFMLLTITVCGFFVLGIYRQGVESQTTTTCTTCSEQYYLCLQGVPQCGENKVQRCRMQGGDEATCENARAQFENECADECYATYDYCWALCSPGTNPPPRDYPGAGCPTVVGSASHDGNGKISGTVGNGAYNAEYDGFGVVFYIDGNASEGTYAGSMAANQETGMRNWFDYSWDIPETYKDGQEHVLYIYVEGGCLPNSFLVPADPGPLTFTLEP